MLLSPGGVCIDMMSRCDNINDCADKSDEADCSRVRKTSKVFQHQKNCFRSALILLTRNLLFHHLYLTLTNHQ